MATPKEAKAAYDREYQAKNKERINARAKEYYLKNKERIKAQQREYDEANKEKKSERHRVYAKKNATKIAEYRRKYNAERVEHAHKKYIQNSAAVRARTRKYYIENRDACLARKKQRRLDNPERAREISRRNDAAIKADPSRYLARILRSVVADQIERGRGKKTIKTVALIGCTIPDFIAHIERQFLPGMTWENRGLRGWPLDHIVPCVWFDLTDPVQQLICFNYQNYQPLWAADNIRKSGTLPEIMERLYAGEIIS